MVMLTSLIPAALSRSERDFVSLHRGYHLLKPPSPSDEPTLQYETLQAIDPGELPHSHIVPSAKAWQATRITKRPGNPYPERISIGRANNCDIVLRFAVVSKLHAHFMPRDDGSMQLCDLGSANGTWHNGRRLASGQRVVLAPGDSLSFGGVQCELYDAVGLYQKVSGARH